MIDTAALREKVLDLAIRGKLVPQDPNDEPASVLLERIRAQKLQMVKEGKLKAKDIKDDTIIFKGDDNCHYEKFADGTIKNIQEEIPFDLPDGWCWSRLVNVSSLVTDYVANGSFASLKENVRTYAEKNYALFVRTVDFAKNFKSDLSYIDKESYEFLEKSKLFGGELMLSNIGASIGKVFKVPYFDMPMSLAPNSIIIRFIDNITSDFFEYVFKSFVGQDYLQFLSGGAAMPKFNKTDLRAMIVPVPPIIEQEKIIKIIESSFSLITEIETASKDLDKTKTLIKSKILELAIQGKLVEQDENDEPASVLLERIHAEKKAQLGKKYVESYIYKGDDNCYYEKIGSEVKNVTEFIPFEIPDSWTWCRLHYILDFIKNGATIKQSTGAKGLPITRIETIASEVIDRNKFGYANIINANAYKNYILENNDILMSHINSPKHLCKCAIYKKEENEIVIHGMNLLNLRFIFSDLAAFMLIIFKDALFRSYVSKEMKHSVNQASITTTQLSSFLFPLPPIQEQKRVVEKITFLVQILEKSLT